jgi:hypothetical protein
LNQTFERLEAAGAEVIQEPIDQSDGVRDRAFLDPFGNVLRFAQPRADASESAHRGSGHPHGPRAT